MEELGYSVVRDGKSFAIAGMSEEMGDKFSRRTALIEETAQKLGIKSEAAKARLGAATREAKTDKFSAAELESIWRDRLSARDREQLVAIQNVTGKVIARDGQAERRAIEWACEHAFERASVMEQSRFLQVALQYGVGQVDVHRLIAVATEHPRLIWKTVDGKQMITTPEVLQEERELCEWVKQGRDTVGPLASRHVIRDTKLSAEQRAAVLHLLESQDRVTGVHGRAGVGKTTLMKEAIEAMESRGKAVTVLAPTAEASRGLLRKEGFTNAETVHQLLCNESLQEKARQGVLWIDEANLLGVREMKRVMELVERLDARVILSGDCYQHGSVSRGDSLRVLIDHAELRLADVTTIRRQQGAYKEAVESFAEGRVAEGFERLDAMGAIREVADEDRHNQLAADYLQALKDGVSALVISPTHAEGAQVTEVIRDELKAAGKIKKVQTVDVLRRIDLTDAERRHPSNYRAGQVIEVVKGMPGHQAGKRLTVSEVADGRVYVHLENHVEGVIDVAKFAERCLVYEPKRMEIGIGEQVRITKNGWANDGENRLYNGSLQKVTGFTDEGDIRLEDGKVISRRYAHIDHGYVTTSHASQGKTVDRVFIAESAESFAAASREQFYVSVSRGRQLVRVYTDSKAELFEAVHASGQRMAALDLMKREKVVKPDEQAHELEQEQMELKLKNDRLAERLGKSGGAQSRVIEREMGRMFRNFDSRPGSMYQSM